MEETKENIARKALQCLYLEVPSEIASDIQQKVLAAFEEIKLSKKKKGNFNVLQEMSDQNNDITLLPINNISSIDIKGSNGYVTFGCPAEFAKRLIDGETFAGGAIFANMYEFKKTLLS